MFDLGKLGDLSKMASQAKQLQDKQNRFQHEQTEILQKISKSLEEIIFLLKKSSAKTN